MNRYFDPEPGRLFDFLQIICFGFEEIPYVIQQRERGILLPREVEEVHRYVWDGVDKDVPGLLSLVESRADGVCFLLHRFEGCIWQWRTSGRFIEEFDRLIHGDLRCEMLAFYDMDRQPMEFYAGLSEDPVRLHEFVLTLNTSDTVKVELLGLLSGTEYYVKSLSTFFRLIEMRLSKIFARYSENLRKQAQVFREQMDRGDEFFLFEKDPKIGEAIQRLHCDEIRLTMSFIAGCAVRWRQNDRSVDIVLGTEYDMLYEPLVTDLDKYSLFFKALSDESRIRILELLKNREMYIGEISRELDIPLTTLAYHVDMLRESEIIRCRNEGKKTMCVFDPGAFGRATGVLIAFSKMARQEKRRR